MLYRVQIRLELYRNYDLQQCLELWDFYFLFLSDISKIKVWKMEAIVPEQCMYLSVHQYFISISVSRAALNAVILMLLLKFHHKDLSISPSGGRREARSVRTYPWWRGRD